MTTQSTNVNHFSAMRLMSLYWHMRVHENSNSVNTYATEREEYYRQQALRNFYPTPAQKAEYRLDYANWRDSAFGTKELAAICATRGVEIAYCIPAHGGKAAWGYEWVGVFDQKDAPNEPLSTTQQAALWLERLVEEIEISHGAGLIGKKRADKDISAINEVISKLLASV